MLEALERFTAAAVEVVEEVIAKVLIIFIRPRTLVGSQGHFAAWKPRYSDGIQSVFLQLSAQQVWKEV
jgi:hypothetical protein